MERQRRFFNHRLDELAHNINGFSTLPEHCPSSLYSLADSVFLVLY